LHGSLRVGTGLSHGWLALSGLILAQRPRQWGVGLSLFVNPRATVEGCVKVVGELLSHRKSSKRLQPLNSLDSDRLWYRKVLAAKPIGFMSRLSDIFTPFQEASNAASWSVVPARGRLVP
jgi:hypothetical protein